MATIFLIIACILAGFSGYYFRKAKDFEDIGKEYYKKGFIDGYLRGWKDYSEEAREYCEKQLFDNQEEVRNNCDEAIKKAREKHGWGN